MPLQSILQELSAGILVVEAPGGRLLQCNPQAERLWRRPLPVTASVEDYTLWQGFHSDGRPYLPAEWPPARSILTGEVVEAEEIQIQRGDGTQGVLRVSSRPVRDARGRIVAGVATCFDITEQKRREAAHRLLFEVSSTLASSLDYERTLRTLARLVIPTLADWCSIDMVGEAGRTERLVVEHSDPHKRELARELEQRYPPRAESAPGAKRPRRSRVPRLIPRIGDRLLRRVARDEEHFHLLRELGLHSAMIVPLVARERMLGEIVLITAESGRRYGPQDLELAGELATRAAMAIDNARLYHESQAANRAKADFLAVISHELRTPLTAIIGYAELLSLGVPEAVTERQKEQVERIEFAARHLLKLIEEILTMASLETGRARIRRDRVEVAELLRRAALITHSLASAKGLDLRVAPVPPGLAVMSDPDKLLQVLLNLLSNAVKFTDRGEIRVSAEERDGFLEIHVLDTGIGVEPRHRERIFDPFWQAEQPITRRVGGTGLGLAISRRVMELLGGELALENTPGTGSTFMMRVPLQVPRAEG